MLAKISILTALLFGLCYPFFLLGNYRETAKSGFYRFNLGLATVIAGLGVFGMYFMEFEKTLKIGAAAWVFALFVITAYLWRKDTRKRWLLLIPTLLGAAVLFQFQAHEWEKPLRMYAMSSLGGLILCGSIFAMNLGHWYLNVKHLPVMHLQKASYLFAGLLGVRLLVDVYLLLTQQIEYAGNAIVLLSFIQVMDGFFLSIALLFGTVLPIILIFFVFETLKIKSTQSATGLLYVIVISVLIGDLTYKYYLVQYGIVL